MLRHPTKSHQAVFESRQLATLMSSPSIKMKCQVLHCLRTANAEATVAVGHAHPDVTGATSGTAVRRLCPNLEGKEVVKGSFSPAAAARAFIAWACRIAPPAVPAETPSASTQRMQRRDRKGAAGREGVGKVVQGRMGNEDDQQGVAETSRASSVALPSIFQAFGADPAAVPVGAPTVSVERGCDRDGKEQENKEEEARKHELVSTERVGNDNERCKVAEVKVAAGATTTALPSIFQAFSAVPPPVAAPEASISSIQQRHERDRKEEDDPKEKEEEEVVGAERMEDAEEQEEAAEMEAPSAGAAAAHASIAQAFPSVDSAAAAVAGASSTNIERGSQEGGEEEDRQQEEGEEKLGKSPGDTFLASLGYDQEIYGSPVPADFRPKDHEDDILCSWSFDFFDKKAGATLLGSGAFGTSAVWRATLVVTHSGLQIDHASRQVVLAPLTFLLLRRLFWLRLKVSRLIYGELSVDRCKVGIQQRKTTSIFKLIAL